MAKETLNDLNSMLFQQIESLSNSDLSGEDLGQEIERARAITNVSKQIINNANVALEVAKLWDDRMNANLKLPAMLDVSQDED